MLIRQDRLWIT